MSPERERNRQLYPATAAVLDVLRYAMPKTMREAGCDWRVAYARENGNEVGDRARFDEWDKAGSP